MEQQPLFARNISKWGSLQKIESREFSYLLNPEPFGDGGQEARLKGFRDIWGQLKAVAGQGGFEIVDRSQNPFDESLNTRAYFDTPDFALRHKGFLIRVSTDYVDGKPEDRCTLVVKENSADDFQQVFQSKLAFSDAYNGKTEIEENVFLTKDLMLDNSLEISKKIILDTVGLGNRRLGDFGKILPRLLELGLSGDTELTCYKTYSYDVKPGRVVLSQGVQAAIKLELWTQEFGAVPFVGDLSFTLETDNYDDMNETHAKAEAFSINVLGHHGSTFAFPNAARWGGSKTRMLLNLPEMGGANE